MFFLVLVLKQHFLDQSLMRLVKLELFHSMHFCAHLMGPQLKHMMIWIFKLLTSWKVCSSCDALILSIQRSKIIAITLCTSVSKQNTRGRSSGCCKHIQNKVLTILRFSWCGVFCNIMRTVLTIKTDRVKLKTMKDQGQNIPMKMIQKIQKQNSCNFLCSGQNITRWWNCKRYEFFKLKVNFFQAVEVQINVSWWK